MLSKSNKASAISGAFLCTICVKNWFSKTEKANSYQGGNVHVSSGCPDGSITGFGIM